MKMPIPFINAYSQDEQKLWLESLQQAMPEEKIIPFAALSAKERAEAKVAIVANTDLDAIKALPNLQWLHAVWAGVEKLVEGLNNQNIAIARLISPAMGRTMAEAVLTWCLYLTRQIPLYRAQQLEKIWKPLPYRPATDITVGIVGFGALGQAAAHMLKTPGFKILGWSRSKKTMDGVTTFDGDDGLTKLLKQSDIIVCLVPLTKETQGLFNAKRFADMKQGAAIINFARGPIIDSNALLDALKSDQLSHAVLDVFNTEPISQNCPYWLHPKITVLPHVAALTNPADAAQIVGKNICHWRKTGQLPPIVDKKRGY